MSVWGLHKNVLMMMTLKRLHFHQGRKYIFAFKLFPDLLLLLNASEKNKLTVLKIRLLFNLTPYF